VDGKAFHARALQQGEALTALLRGQAHALRVVDPRAPAEAQTPAAGRILAPMPGKILDILVAPGQNITRGTVLLVMEAMKVQMRITAPKDATIARILCSTGELVQDNTELITLE
jgi:3-methylcrotonyl-CoA carboxylase alpha subunit